MSELKKDYLLQTFLVIAKSEHLHLGYCEDTEANFVSNREVRQAQENYLDLCMSIIPDEVNSILDVGCGTGEMLKRLYDKNHQVKGMVPDLLLAEKIKEKVPSDILILSKFENYDPEDIKYDLLLFMESFGYIKNMQLCLEKSLSLIDKGGFILICDFFAKKEKDTYSNNFHSMDEFRETYINNDNLELVLHKDITANTMPTMRFLYSMISDYFLPLIDVFVDSGSQSFIKRKPHLYKLLKFFLKKPLQKKYKKLLNGIEQIRPEYYQEACSYELFLFKKV